MIVYRPGYETASRTMDVSPGHLECFAFNMNRCNTLTYCYDAFSYRLIDTD